MKVTLKKKSAFTLVELLLVVGIIAIGSVVAYITLPKVQSTARANAEATNINTIAAGVKNVYAGTNSFGSLTTDVLVNAKAVPEKMLDTTTTPTSILNGFSGAVTIAPTDPLGAAGTTAYTITYAGVPDAECNKLATGVGNNFINVSITNAAATTTAVKTYPSSTPVDPSAVSGACGGDSNTIAFTGN